MVEKTFVSKLSPSAPASFASRTVELAIKIRDRDEADKKIVTLVVPCDWRRWQFFVILVPVANFGSKLHCTDAMNAGTEWAELVDECLFYHPAAYRYGGMECTLLHAIIGRKHFESSGPSAAIFTWVTIAPRPIVYSGWAIGGQFSSWTKKNQFEKTQSSITCKKILSSYGDQFSTNWTKKFNLRRLNTP